MQNKFSLLYYRIVQFLAACVSIFAFKRKIVRNELRHHKGPCVVIANHEASLDFVNLIGTTRRPMHFVISRAFYNTLPCKWFSSRVGLIPKQQFQTTLKNLQEMKKVITDGGILVIYPAGLMCEDGRSTPIPSSTYQFLQWLGTDIFVAKTSGTYFSMPKWASGIRRGRTYLDVYKLYGKEEMADADLDVLKEKINDALSFDAYRDQEHLLVKYKTGDNIEGLENVLYMCPHCLTEFSMRVKAHNTIYCNECGFEEVSDEYAFLHRKGKRGKEYRYVSKWSRLIYDNLQKRIRTGLEEGMSLPCSVSVFNPKTRKHECMGDATVSLSLHHFHIKGTLCAQETDLCIPTANFASLPFKPGKYFEIQHGDVSYRCFPNEGVTVMKFVNMVKIYYEINAAAHEQQRLEREAQAKARRQQTAEAESTSADAVEETKADATSDVGCRTCDCAATSSTEGAEAHADVTDTEQEKEPVSAGANP